MANIIVNDEVSCKVETRELRSKHINVLQRNFAFIMNDAAEITQPVILFDGLCNLCNKAIQFIIKRDRKSIFYFASLQSDFGRSLLQRFNLPVDTFDSFILLKNGKIYLKSTAALLVAKELSGAWRLLIFFMIIPAFIRNSFYEVIANNRYKWFGRNRACWTPSPMLRHRFLD